MRFYTNNIVPRDKVLVELKENGSTGEVSVLLNGVEHLAFGVDGDVVRAVVLDEKRIPGVQYVRNHIKIWRMD